MRFVRIKPLFMCSSFTIAPSLYSIYDANFFSANHTKRSFLLILYKEGVTAGILIGYQAATDCLNGLYLTNLILIIAEINPIQAILLNNDYIANSFK